ncbi:hypothetical protein [Kitasatospora sp. NPDC087314]|uniref:hypothetical protein n=1 Tax=Kitasatospora sp. NPDC087314 TaxID=3364068 RepID=UPI0037F16128
MHGDGDLASAVDTYEQTMFTRGAHWAWVSADNLSRFIAPDPPLSTFGLPIVPGNDGGTDPDRGRLDG